MATIVFIADGWGSQYGGINSFNYDLCLNMHLALNTEEHSIICVTTGEALNEQTYENAKAKDVLLIHFAKDDFDSKKIVKRIDDQKLLQETIWWIGHDIMTGSLAVECAEVTHGKCAIIHHMNYNAYYPYISEHTSDTNKKVDQQIKVFGKADIIFSVGPKLTKSARDIAIKVGKKIKVVELIPGIADITPTENLEQFSVMTFGRISTDQHDVIKQSMLAIKGFAYANRDQQFSINDPDFTIYGLNNDKNEQNISKIRDMASTLAGRIVNLKGYEYSDSRDELWSILRYQSVCMMLSLHEGFGLAGWEAISAGIPLIVSENSGLYELLCHKKLYLKVSSVNICGDNHKNDDSNDIKKVAELLKKIRKNIEAYKKNAEELRNALISDGCTWENTVLTFTKSLQIETKEEYRIRKLVEMIQERINFAPEFTGIFEKDKIMTEFLSCKKYRQCSSCLGELAHDIEIGKIIKVLGIHGSTFCPDANNDVANLLYKDNFISVQILSSQPTSNYLLERSFNN